MISEGLTILSWVTIWNPINFFLFDCWGERSQIPLLRALSLVRVKLLMSDGHGGIVNVGGAFPVLERQGTHRYALLANPPCAGGDGGGGALKGSLNSPMNGPDKGRRYEGDNRMSYITPCAEDEVLDLEMQMDEPGV